MQASRGLVFRSPAPTYILGGPGSQAVMPVLRRQRQESPQSKLAVKTS